MKADVRYMRDGATAEEKYDWINMMPVSFEAFAVESDLQFRAYGVITGEDTGYTGTNAEELRSFVLNRCARGALYRKLMEVTQETERTIGYKLSSRYLEMREVWRGEKIALPHPGATTLEVKRSWYYTDFTAEINYYMQEGITLFLDGSTVIARVDASLFENPDWAILRRRDNKKKLVIDTGHARYAEYDAGEWLLPLATNTVNVVVGDDIDVQHRRYVRLTIAKPLPEADETPPDDATFTPVYPGTNQIIPHEVFSEDDTEIVYQFEVWQLVNAAFAEETANWERADLFKFYREIPFAYYAEVPEYLQLIWGQGKCKTIYQYDPDDPDQANLPRLEAVLMDSTRSIVHLKANNQLVSDLSPWWRAACPCECGTMPMTVTLVLPYKVEPQALPHNLYEQIDDIETAILHRAAAELPISDCACVMPNMGFVWENQQPYQKHSMNAFTGVEITEDRFGALHGTLVYKSKMLNKQLYRRRIKAGNW